MIEKNILPLHHQDGPAMASERQTYYTAAQLIERYPIIYEYKWTAEDLDSFVKLDLFKGRWQNTEDALVEIEKDSFEAFLDYYANRLRQRTESAAQAPTFYTVPQLINRYTTLCDRGWMEEELDFMSRKDFFTGRKIGDSPASLEVEKDSFEAFLDYHNRHIMARAKGRKPD